MSEKIEKQSFIQLCVFSTEEDLERAREELDKDGKRKRKKI